MQRLLQIIVTLRFTNQNSWKMHLPILNGLLSLWSVFCTAVHYGSNICSFWMMLLFHYWWMMTLFHYHYMQWCCIYLQMPGIVTSSTRLCRTTWLVFLPFASSADTVHLYYTVSKSVLILARSICRALYVPVGTYKLGVY